MKKRDQKEQPEQWFRIVIEIEDSGLPMELLPEAL